MLSSFWIAPLISLVFLDHKASESSDLNATTIHHCVVRCGQDIHVHTINANTVHIVPCGIQAGSGTYKFWNTITGASVGAEATATTLCNSLITNALSGRAEENSGDALKARGDALAALSGHANDEVIIGFSAGSYIARVNGAAPMVGANTVNLGSISDNGLAGTNQNTALGAAFSGTAPNLAPVSGFYSDTKFGRYIYTEVFYFLMVGNLPTLEQTRVLDACLVTLMEHGFTPALLTRDELATIHGHNERISVANLRLGTEVLFEVVRRLVGNA